MISNTKTVCDVYLPIIFSTCFPKIPAFLGHKLRLLPTRMKFPIFIYCTISTVHIVHVPNSCSEHDFIGLVESYTNIHLLLLLLFLKNPIDVSE